MGIDITYVDLSVFQIIEGLRYAFSNAMAGIEPRIPRLVSLRDRVGGRPRIAAYLASARRLPFNQQGIFRRYPELDAEPGEVSQTKKKEPGAQAKPASVPRRRSKKAKTPRAKKKIKKRATRR